MFYEIFDNIDGVIFDLDGTLIDSMGIWLQIDADYLGARGIAVPNNMNKMTEGKSFTEVANLFKETFKLEESIEEIKAEWIGMAKDYYANKIPLKAGAEELLVQLKTQGKKVGLGTSCSRDLAMAVLKQHNLLTYFQTIVTSCEVPKGKPSPDVFLKGAELLKISAEKTLVFEDTIAGVQAAKAAGMKVVALYDLHAEEDQEELRNLADYYLESIEELGIKDTATA
ncbi:HAD family hydrolase [Alkaliphilus transvaalensis]|uniref:HAD family hydrolase n=1 Tax=Alkaliphilus transvaalensis TaxID=114628 RepID=UPI000683EEA3|nr:HAD family phosphatase [Alkaliphilus transvaalensis]